MSADVLIKVKGVSKKFCRSLKKSLRYGVSDICSDLNPFCRDKGDDASPANDLRDGEFWAVKDISFELRRGECLGLVGRNGAGKTTLLKMLNGLVKPDGGRIEMRGRIGALIALGAGFNPILTGRENIYVNGSVLGLSKKEIDGQIEDIIDFAEIREFIDSPVQSYSSGMQVRLGFAVATALKPDVLLLDEVLAVGDAAFRNKCYYRIGKLRQDACVIFVSHDMESVAHICDRVLVLKDGTTAFEGEILPGMEEYNKLNKIEANEGESFIKILPPLLEVECQPSKSEISYGGNIEFDFRYNSTETVIDPCLRFCFYDRKGAMVAEWDSIRNGFPLAIECGRGKARINLGPILLKTGTYNLGIQLHDVNFFLILFWSYKIVHLKVTGISRGYAPYQVASIKNGP